jgi:hypothetical protein
MGKFKLIAGIGLFVLVCNLGWQIGASELASIELRDDMRDLTSQIGGRIGLLNAKSDDDFRNAILSKAQKYDIRLEPEQITVQRSGEGLAARVYLAAAYNVPIRIPGFAFQLHFNPESGTRQN